MRSKLRATFATAAAAAMVLGAAGLAAADDIDTTSESPSYSVVSGVKTFVMEIGETASATLTYSEKNDDGRNGCNLGGWPGTPGAQTQLVLDVVGTAAPGDSTAGLTGLPATVTFADCGSDDAPATVELNFTAESAGTTYFSFPVNTGGTVAQGTFDTSAANFMVTVLAPEEDEGRDAPAIANEYLKGLDSDKLEACKLANGTNKNRANWHGQLISKVAQHFEGQTFGPSKEHVVTDYVDSQC
jgi:hypothetical protein